MLSGVLLLCLVMIVLALCTSPSIDQYRPLRKLIEPVNQFQGRWMGDDHIQLNFDAVDGGTLVLSKPTRRITFTYRRDRLGDQHVATVTRTSSENVLPRNTQFSLNARSSGELFVKRAKETPEGIIDLKFERSN